MNVLFHSSTVNMFRFSFYDHFCAYLCLIFICYWIIIMKRKLCFMNFIVIV